MMRDLKISADASDIFIDGGANVYGQAPNEDLSVSFRVTIHLHQLEKMVRRAAINSSRKSVDGPVHVRIIGGIVRSVAD